MALNSVYERLFQSTLPQGERLFEGRSPLSPPGFQSTLPQGERPYLCSVPQCGRGISIHAPARGATSGRFLSINSPIFISIHAPARGATQQTIATLQQNVFQSTLPQGERPTATTTAKEPREISIHAPARGATKCRLSVGKSQAHFNPRSRKGSDSFLGPGICSNPDFNPRSRKGSDLCLPCKTG